MLLRFGAQNFRSFRDRVELSFVSTAQRDAPTWRFPAPGLRFGVLPVVGVYGANASGKSNLLAALRALRDHVAWSFVALRPDQPIPFTPFVLQGQADTAPVALDVDVLVQGVRYHFGYRHTEQAVVQEWLYAWPGGRRQVLYHREGQDTGGWWLSPSLRLGRGLRGQIVKATRPNALLLSTAAQFNAGLLGEVATAIGEAVQTESPIDLHGHPVFLPDHPVVQDQHRATVLRFLEAADLGVKDIKPVPLKRRDEVLEALRQQRKPEAFEEVVKALADDDNAVELWLVHEGADGTRWTLPPAQESRGTQVLLARLNDLLLALELGSMLVLDELDTSLHPDLCRALVGLFTDPHSNPRGAQLLFTSHDRGLLSALRRDQVVLVDKDREGVSHLRSAADFRGLRGRDDLLGAHAQGRLGGVPVLGDLAGALSREAGRGA
ncbi:AAA family ATPase [Myxococcota bacterium]|nr:AAA family ATPase [Myxococcota bacterium]